MPDFELYDLQQDPGETTNLAAQYPDVVARLKEAYDHWFDDVSSTRPDNYDPPRIVLGTEYEKPTVLTKQDWRGGSWSPGDNGEWEVKVETAQPVDVRVLMDPHETAGTATLFVGPVVRQVQLAPHADETQIPDVMLPAGNFRLRVDLQYGSQLVGPNYVYVQ